MVAYNKSNLYTILNTFLFFTIFLSHHICVLSKIVIPFTHYNNNSESFVLKYSEDSIYSEIQSGSYSSFPDGKKIDIFFNLKTSKFLISPRKVCPQTSYYNKNESSSYAYKNSLSQDSFYFYTDLQTLVIKKYNEIAFSYSENKEKNIFCGDMGLNIPSSHENIDENIVYNLKNKNYINDYYLSFRFNEIKPFDNYDSLKGEIIIGKPPHEYDENKYSLEQFKYDKSYLQSINSNSYNNYNYQFNFDKVYVGLKDKEKEILKNIDNSNKYLLLFEVSYGLITGPKSYQDYIEANFFNKSEIANLCKKSKDYGTMLDYDIFVCENEIKTKFNIFPEISFYYENFDYNFTFNYEDLFMLRNNKYYFKIIFAGLGYNQWRFGLPFFLKYQLVFNQDSKQIGFYDDNIIPSKNKKNDNNSIVKNVWFWIILIIIIIVIIIGTIFITKNIFTKRKKKANELDDGYDYEAHKGEQTNNNNNNDDKNKLFENEGIN